MAHVILAGFLCAAFVTFGDSAVTLDVTPPVIQIGQTESLDVVCKVEKGDSSGALFFIALSHSPSGDGSSFSYLAYLNSADVKLTTPDTAAVAASGLMNGSGVSHVALTWRRPAQGRAGVYKCDVTGIDASGGPVSVSKLAAVTASGDDGSGFWRLSDKVADVHGRLDSLQESETREFTEVKNKTSDLQRQIHNLRSDLAAMFKIESGTYECGESKQNFPIPLYGTFKAEDNHITFRAPFRTNPVILQSVTFLDAGYTANLRIDIEVRDVTTTGFVGRCKTWSNTVILLARIQWTAISFPTF